MAALIFLVIGRAFLLRSNINASIVYLTKRNTIADRTKPMRHEVEFNHDDTGAIGGAVDRWSEVCANKGWDFDRISTTMDLAAANGVNGNPALDLEKLLGFDDFSFVHDIAGIQRHIDRSTGKLGGCFLPRCVAPENQPA